jgi:hypothetical protein
MRDSMLCVLAAAALSCCAAPSRARAGTGCVEGFDDVPSLRSHGWLETNNSDPVGTTGWFQGNPGVFPAYSGATDSYVSADADNASGDFPVLSNWLITPEIAFGPNAFGAHAFAFLTRAAPGAPNRVVIRLCIEAQGTDCRAPGPESGDLGGYTAILLTINDGQVEGGYPQDWAPFTLSPADGLPVTGRGRIAFHYYGFWQPPDIVPGSTVGFDDVSMTGADACPFSETVFASGFE